MTRTLDGFVALDAVHQRFLEAVDELEKLVQSLESEGATPPAQARAMAIVSTLSQAAQHHEDEERHVFPALLSSADQMVSDVVRRLIQDHGWLEENWLEIGPHLKAVASGYGTWDIDTLRAGVPIYGALLREHVALEESMAYPQARSQITAEGRESMGRAMAARHREARLARRQYRRIVTDAGG